MWCSGGAGPEMVAVALQPAEQPGQGRHLCGFPIGHHVAEPAARPYPRNHHSALLDAIRRR